MTFQDGIILFKSGDYNAAADHFSQVIKKEKENHQAWNALGTCLSKLEKYDDANTCFKNALQLQPDNDTYKKNINKNDLNREQEAWSEKGDALTSLGRFKEALMAMYKAVQIVPNSAKNGVLKEMLSLIGADLKKH